MKVLIADDSKTSLLTLKHVLVKLGHEVVSTLDVHSILELYTNENPDLIILDVVMDEEVDGFQIAKEIRAIEKNWIPIIFLSARVDDEYIKKGVDAGGDDYLLKPCSDITISAKIKAMQRISHMRSKLVDISDKLKTLSSYDPLTQAPNRMLFESKFISSISRAKRNNSFMALLFIDLDNFKYVNDTLGHDVGDDLLKYVTTSFTSILRECDTLHNPGTIKPIDLDDPKF
ncbi:MAG: response regulator, partial [Francisellaceae bacterium]|nr:response regulator [Francisellaceae bacterium]